ncbi:hypothetical protein EOT10_40625 [Streptomyces antnestii]|uniref:Uncharacterized protein n=1 Tax=Streptomyces antnestii TaxID=2494256 RepID=A0A437NX74_9ACTN|nr:hypothetical protein [Streptomyces sp. San01]RVU14600.1 hypothetical protein EOT10_40625 [Streptomyces sp. San01]
MDDVSTVNGRPSLMARYIGNGNGEKPCQNPAVIGDRCLTHTPDRAAARRHKIRSEIKGGLGCLGILSLLAAGVVYGLPVAADWAREQAREYCQPAVTSYEKARKKADAIRIPLLFGTEFLNGDEEITEPDILAAYREKRAAAGEGAKIALAHQNCFEPQVIGRANQIRLRPKEATFAVMPDANSPYAVLVFDGTDGIPEHKTGLPPDLRLWPAVSA